MYFKIISDDMTLDVLVVEILLIVELIGGPFHVAHSVFHFPPPIAVEHKQCPKV